MNTDGLRPRAGQPKRAGLVSVSDRFRTSRTALNVLFCTSRYGWGWKNFLTEANTGAGPRFPKWAHAWIAYGIPVLMVVIFIMGYIPKFQIWFGL